MPRCGIENFEVIVSERVQVNPDNSRVMSELTFLQPGITWYKSANQKLGIRTVYEG